MLWRKRKKKTLSLCDSILRSIDDLREIGDFEDASDYFLCMTRESYKNLCEEIYQRYGLVLETYSFEGIPIFITDGTLYENEQFVLIRNDFL